MNARREQRPTPRPIRRTIVKGHSIIRNPGTGPLIERLREPERKGPIGFHGAVRTEQPE